MIFKKANHCTGEVTIPGDKSISHRAVMFGSLAEGTTEITNFLQGADCLSTIDCFRKMGISIDNTPERILIHGKGLHVLMHLPLFWMLATAVLPPALSPVFLLRSLLKPR